MLLEAVNKACDKPFGRSRQAMRLEANRQVAEDLATKGDDGRG